jgi:hypothetical protein
MTRDQFIDASELTKLAETDKVCYLAFFYLKTNSLEEFTAIDGARWLSESGISNPNRTRLDQNLRASRNTIKGQRGLKLTLPFVKSLETKFPAVTQKSQDVIDHGTILPEVDYVDTRGYIISLAKQMNVSFEQNLFDGCAVLMRRLLEIMLILSYRKLSIESAIQDAAGNYKMLEGIINDAKTNSTLALSRNSKGMLDTFRELGNFSAHKIEYTCRREYIQPHIQDYRALIVELLYKSGIRV